MRMERFVRFCVARSRLNFNLFLLPASHRPAVFVYQCVYTRCRKSLWTLHMHRNWSSIGLKNTRRPRRLSMHRYVPATPPADISHNNSMTYHRRPISVLKKRIPHQGSSQSYGSWSPRFKKKVPSVKVSRPIFVKCSTRHWKTRLQ